MINRSEMRKQAKQKKMLLADHNTEQEMRRKLTIEAKMHNREEKVAKLQADKMYMVEEKK